ncbi:MAG: ribosomal protein S18-alanine N-acetyltransferase [Gammaproteobacteria bacterium]|nr:ribosomal protein S18-alanine N-acetyltransferase [Gammaproteobacteria bacterium]
MLRPMTENDLGTVIEIEHAAYPFPWTMGMFRDCLRIGYCCRVLEESKRGGDLVGYGIISIGGGEAQLLNLCIRKERRNQGIARRLLADLIDTAKERDADSMFLEVRPSNHAARELYQHMGFNEVGIRPAYYPVKKGGKKGSEDALILALAL